MIPNFQKLFIAFTTKTAPGITDQIHICLKVEYFVPYNSLYLLTENVIRYIKCPFSFHQNSSIFELNLKVVGVDFEETTMTSLWAS